MRQRIRDFIGLFFSPTFLKSRFMLWALFWVNFPGTIYGYIWYWDQLVWTAKNKPAWMLPIVPDSPTASLFFTVSLVFLLWDSYRNPDKPRTAHSFLRSLIETVAVVTSFKYGIWAVVMIFSGAAQGVPLVWQDWMLTVSHLGMAAEALLYARFFRIRPVHLALAALWTFGNDLADYGFGIYPNLPRELQDDLPVIQVFTMVLSAVSLVLADWTGYRRYVVKHGDAV